MRKSYGSFIGRDGRRIHCTVASCYWCGKGYAVAEAHSCPGIRGTDGADTRAWDDEAAPRPTRRHFGTRLMDGFLRMFGDDA